MDRKWFDANSISAGGGFVRERSETVEIRGAKWGAAFLLLKEGERSAMKPQGVRIKNNRPAGQGEKQGEAQVMVVVRRMGCYKLWYLPTILGQLPKIADVLRTTAGEKGLTLMSSQ